VRNYFLLPFSEDLQEIAAVGLSGSLTRGELRFFKGIPPAESSWSQPPPDEPAPSDDSLSWRPQYPPLSEREKWVYASLAIIGLMPLLLLMGVYILAHSPLLAN
jgi:hypothetical protein